MAGPDQTFPAADLAEARPLVAPRGSNRSVWIFGGVLAAVAAGLFVGLEARRSERAPGLGSVNDANDAGVIAAPPELAVPEGGGSPEYLPPLVRGAAYGPPGLAGQGGVPAAAAPAPASSLRIPTPRVVYQPPPTYMGAPGSNQPGYQPASQSMAPVTVTPEAAGLPGAAGTRASAAWLANPARTVPQGTVIHAVLETALDSTKPGYARALVSRDVTSFDGSRVLIPRGSRLFGEYAADLNFGQKRALIQWHRLTRPDGAIVDVDSPSADPLGRAGVKGKVNSHFLQRFSGAILQSALDAGVQLATRAASGDTVVLGLPNSSQTINSEGQRPDNIRPTLKVRQGSSVAVFVARDLDFSSVEP